MKSLFGLSTVLLDLFIRPIFYNDCENEKNYLFRAASALVHRKYRRRCRQVLEECAMIHGRNFVWTYQHRLPRLVCASLSRIVNSHESELVRIGLQ